MEMADLRTNLETVYRRIEQACLRSRRRADEITLVAVTKTVSPPLIEMAHKMGIHHFGENRVQEAQQKFASLDHLQPRPVWHLIGHLQSNKVKPALALFDVIHSVDTVEIASAISRRAQKQVPVFLEVNVAGEATKSGFSLAEIQPAFTAITQMPNLEVQGLMTVAPFVPDPELVRPVFRKLRELRDTLHLVHLSMGMTADFEVAIEEGATMVRIGQAIFGAR
jgi:PLP dependent protein